MSAVPSLQDIARRMYIMELTLAGEYSRLCLRFIRRCVNRAIRAESLLPGEEVPEVVRERSSLVVRAARWFAHDMLFRVGAILSAPYVDQGLIGTHVEVIGDEFQRVRRGAYVTLELRPFQPDSDTESDLNSSVESQRLVTTNTVMIARGRIDDPIANRTRSRVGWGNEPMWVVQDGAGGELFRVGWMEDEG